MSYHGKQYKGASKDRKIQKRAEAEARNASSDVRNCACGNRHATSWAGCKIGGFLREYVAGGAA